VEVAISAVSAGSDVQLRFEVRDTGPGIPVESQPRIFEKFYQSDSAASRAFGGTGLGLAICRELVQAMGGEIGFRSGEGVGSTFWFVVPVRAAAGKQQVAPAAASVASARGRVLLVEDNTVNQRVAKRLLEKAGCEVEVAPEGKTALELFGARRYDAVFMDIQMPGMDGYEAVALMRKAEAGRRRTPVIALTASAMAGDRERCLASGMDDHLAKPIDLVELNRVLRSWLPDASAEKQPSAHSGTGLSAGR
jgi:CheY-like chemotaxis protein